MNPDTRVALVKENTASKRVKKALLSAKEDAFLSIDVQVDAVLAELFPEADKPVRVGDLHMAADKAEGCEHCGHQYVAAAQAADRIREELSRG